MQIYIYILREHKHEGDFQICISAPSVIITHSMSFWERKNDDYHSGGLT